MRKGADWRLQAAPDWGACLSVCVLQVEAKLKARQEAKDAELEAACAARELTVYFNADVNDQLPWKFAPTQRSVKVWRVEGGAGRGGRRAA